MATTIPVIKLKRGTYTALSNVPYIDGTLYFGQNAIIDAGTAQADATERNIFVVDVSNDDGTSVNRRKLDAYRAFYADAANVASVADSLSTSVALKIASSDGTGAGDASTLTGSEGTSGVTLKLPSSIKANLTGNVTGNASTASALNVSAAIGSSSKPVYINASGVPVACGNSLDVSITGSASSADTWSSKKNFSISDAGTGTNKHTGTAVGVDGSDNVELVLPSTITATLNGRANSALKLVNSSNQNISTSNNKAVYFNAGVPTEITAALAHDITGNAATASVATALAAGAGSTSNPVYITSGGVPTAVTSINVDLLGDQVIPIKNLPKSVQERLFITSRAANGNASSDAAAINAYIASKANSNDPVEAGDVIQITDGDTPNAMYYIYEDDGVLKSATFTAGASSNAVYAQNAGALDHTVTWQIKDADNTNTGVASTAANLSGGSVIINLPSTIKATLTGLADKAKALNNTSAIGSSTKPVYFNASGVPVVCDDSLNINALTATTLESSRTINGTAFDGSQNITTANWGTARNITIVDSGTGSNKHSGTAVSVNGSQAYELPLPSTITASLNGNATTATTASKTAATLTLNATPVSGSEFTVGTFNGAKVNNADINWNLGVNDLFPLHTATATISSTISAGTWTTMTAATPAMTTGTYIVQITTNNKTFNFEVFSGVMSYSSLNGAGTDTDEVLLHSAGADLKGHRIYMRVKRVSNGALQIRYCADVNLVSGDVLTFKFRRII